MSDVSSISDAVTQEMKESFEKEAEQLKWRWRNTSLQESVRRKFMKWPGVSEKGRAHLPIMRFVDLMILDADA